MQDKGLVSIICPCYNAEKYLHEIVSDVLAQTYTNWELIIVSNGNNQQKQLEVAKALASKDKRIHVIHDDAGGVSRARNTGIGISNGKWIVFVDADDRIEKEHLQNFIEVADGESELIVMGYKAYTSSGIDVQSLKAFDSKSRTGEDGIKEALRRLLVQYESIAGSPCNKMFKKSFLDSREINFDTRFAYYEDAIFCLTCLKECKRLQLIDKESYHYIIHPNSSNSKYQPGLETAYKQQEILYLPLYKKAEMPMDFLESKWNDNTYIHTYFLVCNMYKTGCDLERKEKVANIKRWVYNEDFFKALKYNKVHASTVRIFDIGVTLKSATLLHFYMKLLFAIRQKIKNKKI